MPQAHTREVTPTDADAWRLLRQALWPEDRPGEHREAINRYFAGHRHEPAHVLVAEVNGRLVGFAELSIRNIVDSCESDRVGYLEGLYVAPDARRLGIGRALVASAEHWAIAQGCREFGSDAEIDNDVSAAVHLALGFEETSRVRNFRKRPSDPSDPSHPPDPSHPSDSTALSSLPTMTFLKYMPPMGIYETLYAFLAAFGRPMGDPGTHPWSQGFPRTDQLPGGPPMPGTITVPATDLKYPKAWGLPALREEIAGYYRTHYGAKITADNVMIFAGGRPALIAVLYFLDREIRVRVAETEYTPYFDMLERLGRTWSMVASHEGNRFTPSVAEYLERPGGARSLVLLSNPCNPTGITRRGAELRQLVDAASSGDTGLLIDEAYELFQERPESAMQYARDIDASNLFVVGAATKGLQAPGIRIGWVVAAKKHIEILGNFSSFGMGGVSHPSQRYALELLQPDRVAIARKAVPAFYHSQRERYGRAFKSIGLELFTGDGGFYHWCRLPAGLSADELNRRLFPKGAAILKGTDCDMARRGAASPLNGFFRFSFGPLQPESFEADVDILKHALGR